MMLPDAQFAESTRPEREIRKNRGIGVRSRLRHTDRQNRSVTVIGVWFCLVMFSGGCVCALDFVLREGILTVA